MNFLRRLMRRMLLRAPRILPRRGARRPPRGTRNDLTPQQWGRWWKANRRRQRQLTALKRLGVKIHPNDTGLPRWSVK